MEETNGAKHEKFATFLRLVESADGSVGRERDRAGREDGHCGLPDVQSRTVGVHKFEAAIFVALSRFILGVTVALRVLALLASLLLGLTLGHTDELLVKATVANESLLRVQVLLESLTDNAVSVDENAKLLEHGVDVGVHAGFATLVHDDEG